MAKKKKAVTRRGKRWTYKERVEILKTLEANEMNYAKTSKTFGVSRQTIYKWVEEMGSSVFTPVESYPVEQVEEAVEIFTGEEKTQYRERLGEAKMKIIEKIIDLVKQERNLDNLQKALKTVSELEKEDNPPLKGAPGSNTGNGNLTFLQIIEKQIIENKTDSKIQKP